MFTPAPDAAPRRVQRPEHVGRDRVADLLFLLFDDAPSLELRPISSNLPATTGDVSHSLTLASILSSFDVSVSLNETAAAKGGSTRKYWAFLRCRASLARLLMRGSWSQVKPTRRNQRSVPDNSPRGFL